MTTQQEIQLGLAVLPIVETAVPEFIAWLTSLRGAAQQADEWTPEQDADFEAAIDLKKSDPKWQPDTVSEPSSEPTPPTDTPTV